MVKKLNERQVDDLIRLKYGSLVSSTAHTQYASNATLGRIFGVSATKVRELYMERFTAIQYKQLSFLQQLARQKLR